MHKYLIEHFLLQPNQDPNNPSLSCALLHLTFTQEITIPTADTIRLIAILFDTMLPLHATPSLENAPPTSHPSLIEQIDKLSASIQEIKETTDINRRLAEALTRTIDISKEEMHVAAQLVADAAETRTLTTRCPHPQSDDNDILTTHPQLTTYAAAVKHSPHARAVDCCTAQARTICLTPPSNDSESPLINLSEEVLIQKANLVLELAHKHGGPIPLDAQFIAARKTTHKNVLYEVDSEDTVAWL